MLNNANVSLVVAFCLGVAPGSLAADLSEKKGPETNPDPTEMQCRSISRHRYFCETPVLDNNSPNHTYTVRNVRFTVPDNLFIVRETVRGDTMGGRCGHRVSYFPLTDLQSVTCSWFAEGCGIFRDGGYVVGKCTVEAMRKPVGK